MSAQANISVATGPDRGKSFTLTGELTRVGKGPQNDLVLTDSHVTADHLASIVERDGRYAIITTVQGGLEIDGTEVPAERWVWLPDMAKIRVTNETSLQFFLNGSPRAPDSGVPASAAPPPVVSEPAADAAGRDSASPSAVIRKVPPVKTRRAAGDSAGSSDELPRKKRATGERPEKKPRAATVARFITDGPGDPLVKLGEDGHLPELTLKEGHTREGHEPTQTKTTNPAVLLLAIGASLLMTLGMLFMEGEGYGDNTRSKAEARSKIEKYYGSEKDNLKPYQIYLRQARQARSRGDIAAEQFEYRQVLNLLHSEANEKLYRYTGITGRLDYDQGDADQMSDRHLEEQIAVLLSD
ncbi:MAG: hypothetical protein EXS05_19670 [Planctomycetaceae bacterium]|nr:hypothetical protein [Planctomycetaceae bacterium]